MRIYQSKLEVIRFCKANPGQEAYLDAGEGWLSVWVSDRKGKEPKRTWMVNPQGMRLIM